MRRSLLLSLIAPAAAFALLLAGCGLTSTAASSANKSVISSDWLDNATSYFVDDPIAQSVARIRAQPQVDAQGRTVSQGDSFDDLKLRILKREIFTQILESEIFKLGYSPQPWLDDLRPQLEPDFRRLYQSGGVAGVTPSEDGPQEGAIELITRWIGVQRAFFATALGTPDTPNQDALAMIYSRMPILGRKLCLTVIGVVSSDKVKQVGERLKAGEDFGAVAADLSDHPGSKDRKGDVGCVTAVEARKALEDSAVFDLAAQAPPGTFAGPFQGESGAVWFVRVSEQGSVGGDFESAIPQLVAQYEEARLLLAQAAAARLYKEADVRVVCPLGRWVATGPLAESPMILPCASDPNSLLQPQVVEAGGAPPQGAPAQGAPAQGAPPQGAPPQGAPPQGAPPQGAPPQSQATPS